MQLFVPFGPDSSMASGLCPCGAVSCIFCSLFPFYYDSSSSNRVVSLFFLFQIPFSFEGKNQVNKRFHYIDTGAHKKWETKRNKKTKNKMKSIGWQRFTNCTPIDIWFEVIIAKILPTIELHLSGCTKWRSTIFQKRTYLDTKEMNRNGKRERVCGRVRVWDDWATSRTIHSPIFHLFKSMCLSPD